MALDSDKKTECIKVHADERLYVDLNRLAAADDRKLSEYIYRVLSNHVYGHGRRATEISEGPERA